MIRRLLKHLLLIPGISGDPVGLGDLLGGALGLLLDAGGWFAFKVLNTARNALGSVTTPAGPIDTPHWRAALQAVQPTLTAPIQPVAQHLDYAASATGFWTDQVTEGMVKAAGATQYLKAAVNGAGVESRPSLQSQVDSLGAVVATDHADQATVNNELRAEIVALSDYLNGPYHAAIVARIAQAELDAEVHSREVAIELIQDQDHIFQHRAAALADARGLTIPWAADTIPIALAGIAAAVVPIEAEMLRCVNPMCSDWNAAKGLLEGLVAGIGTVGAIEFLVGAITHPESFGKTVAGYADEVGNLAVDSFYGILGLGPPPPTEPIP